MSVKADDVPPVNASTLSLISNENWNVLANGLMSMQKNETIPASPLADLYRQELGEQNSTSDKEMPIPQDTTSISGTSIPICEPFLNSISQDYESSFGLESAVENSSMVPYDNFGGCQIYTYSQASPNVVNVSTNNSSQTWTLQVGPTSATDFAEYVFTQLTFEQLLLEKMNSGTKYQSSSCITINFPDNYQLLNSANITNLNWEVDFGGGNSITASVSSGTSIVINEALTVTQQNTTISMADLPDAFQGFMNFQVVYAQPYYCNKIGTPQPANPNPDFSWSYTWPLGNMNQPFEFTIPVAGSSISCDAYFQMNTTFEVNWNPTIPIPIIDPLTSFYSSITTNVYLNLSISASMSAEYESTLLETTPYDLLGTQVGTFIGPIPVEINLDLTLQALLNGGFNTSCSFTTGYIATGYVQSGLQYSPGKLVPFYHSSLTGEFIPLTGSQYNVEAYLEPELKLTFTALFYGQAGPSLTIEPYVDFVISDTEGNLQIQITGAINILVGFQFASDLRAILGLGSIGPVQVCPPIVFWTATWDLASTHYDLGITDVSTSESPIYPQDNVTVTVGIANLGNAGPESCDVNLTLDNTTAIGSTQTIQPLASGTLTNVEFNWTVPEVIGDLSNHTLEAYLSNFSPNETTGDGNDYSINNQFDLAIDISPMYYVDISSNNTDAGTINLQSGHYDQNSATIAAIPNPGYSFCYWVTTGNATLSSNSSSTTMTVTEEGAVQGFFAPYAPVSDITICSNGVPYTVDGNNYYDNFINSTNQLFTWIQGSTHTIVTYSTDYESEISYEPLGFTSPSINIVNGTTLIYTVPTANETIDIEANINIFVTINNTFGGSVSPSGSTWYSNGQSLPINATKNPGYEFAGWKSTDPTDIIFANASSASTTVQMGSFGTITANFIQPSSIQITNVQVPSAPTQNSFMMPMNVTLTNPDYSQETASIQVTMNSTSLLGVPGNVNASVFGASVTLNPLETETVPCNFNTSLLFIGNYSYTVTVTTTSLTGSPTSVATGQTGLTYLGDLNGDFAVNFNDITSFVSDYIAYNTNGVYNPAID